MRLSRAAWRAATWLAIVGCGKGGAPPQRLDRDTVRRVLSADSLWITLDVLQEFSVDVAAPYACDNLAAGEEGDGGQAERLRTSGLVLVEDSSVIMPDSVAHLCVSRMSDRGRQLAAEAGGRPMVIYVDPRVSGGRRGVLRIRTHLAELDSVTGIQQADGAVTSSVDFTVKKIPSELGRQIGAADSVIRAGPLHAVFDRYDDGWRLHIPRR